MKENYGRGVFWNQSQGLISFCYDTLAITIKDKNLGATAVQTSASSGSTTWGNLYQRGNNYGFGNSSLPSSMSSTKVNAENYGPGNYYSSSTFINAGNTGWDSSNNGNLWGGRTDTYEAMKGPCDTGYHVPSLNDTLLLEYIMQSLGLLSQNSGSNTLTSTQYNNITNCLKWYVTKTIGYTGAQISSTNGIVCTPTKFRGSGMSYRFYISYVNSNYYWYDPVKNSGSYNGSTCAAYPIRPFKNEVVKPDSSRTTLYSN